MLLYKIVLSLDDFKILLHILKQYLKWLKKIFFFFLHTYFRKYKLFHKLFNLYAFHKGVKHQMFMLNLYRIVFFFLIYEHVLDKFLRYRKLFIFHAKIVWLIYLIVNAAPLNYFSLNKHFDILLEHIISTYPLSL